MMAPDEFDARLADDDPDLYDPRLDEHELGLGRRLLGTSMAGRPLYGTLARCSCGWTHEDNEAPSKGGNSFCKAAHKDHLLAECEHGHG